MPITVHDIEHFLASAFNFCCNPLSPRRRLTTRIWIGAVITFTLSTTGFMLGCICTDQWEITTFDYRLLNESIYNNSIDSRSSSNNDQCTFTHTRQYDQGLLIVTTARNQLTTTDGSEINNRSLATRNSMTDQSISACQGTVKQQNISLAFRQYGGAFQLCLDVGDEIWTNLTRICSPLEIDKCLYYNPTSVKSPFCCKRCLYSVEEVQELDENGDVTFEPIFTVIGFLIVCLVILSVCQFLAIIAIWKRLVPVVMFTGILFLVAGTFMAFCLAAHQYKISIMNSNRRNLPHMTHEMAFSSRTEMGWSIDCGWMGFAFSVLTGILWIRFSFHLASETTYNKIRPTDSLLIHGNSINRGSSIGHAANSMENGMIANGGYVPKSVRWAAKEPATATPSSRPNSDKQLMDRDPQTKNVGVVANMNGASGGNAQKGRVDLPFTVEEAV